MSSSITLARELLARTRNISASLDAIVEPHLRIIKLKNDLSLEPFTGLALSRKRLMFELDWIESLLSQGMAAEAWSAINAYEGRLALLAPSLQRLVNARDRMTLETQMDIEERIMGNDLTRAECALRALESDRGAKAAVPAVPAPVAEDLRSCGLCGRSVRTDARLCPYCGWDPEARSADCPYCGSTVLMSFRSCPSCGKKVFPAAGEGRLVTSLIC
ncbi:MAG: zinc ribbon domain-containing protein [Methanomassiliicoccus sp.]|nr:zinc ribbon domain-containing protein [Methanomassiliicoccus sp.]